jgi:hypothetical protein
LIAGCNQKATNRRQSDAKKLAYFFLKSDKRCVLRTAGQAAFSESPDVIKRVAIVAMSEGIKLFFDGVLSSKRLLARHPVTASLAEQRAGAVIVNG